VTSPTVFLCDTCASDAKVTGAELVGTLGLDSLCSWCGQLASTVYTAKVLEPLLGQYGQMAASWSLDLDLVNRVIWDVNGYYRELGVDPHAPRETLREAYRARGRHDDRLTYIAKVLLNRETRREYDALQIGQLWFDPWLSAVVRDAVLDDAVPSSEPDPPEREAAVRQELRDREDHPVDLRPSAQETSNVMAEWDAHWGHYTLCIGPRAWLMARWRLMLAIAARSLGVRIPGVLKVGVMRSEESWQVVVQRSGPIFFLNVDVVATTELAEAAIVSLRWDADGRASVRHTAPCHQTHADEPMHYAEHR